MEAERLSSIPWLCRLIIVAIGSLSGAEHVDGLNGAECRPGCRVFLAARLGNGSGCVGESRTRLGRWGRLPRVDERRLQKWGQSRSPNPTICQLLPCDVNQVLVVDLVSGFGVGHDLLHRSQRVVVVGEPAQVLAAAYV